MSRLLVGVDCGGSSTAATIVRFRDDGTHEILGDGAAGPSNLRSAPPAETGPTIRSAVDAALAEANVSLEQIGAVGIAAAGGDSSDAATSLKRWLRESGWGDLPVAVHHDAAAVLAAAGLDHGIALIAGTGSIVYGLTTDGRSFRAGGWGSTFGDEGSGYWIGVAALRAVAHAADGRGPATTLTGMLCRHYGVAEPTGLIGRVHQHRDRVREVAGAAPVVFAASQGNDAVGTVICADAVKALAQAVSAVWRRMPPPDRDGPLACTGGLLLNLPHYRDRLAACLEGDGLPSVLEPVPRPALGAARLARKVPVLKVPVLKVPVPTGGPRSDRD